MNVEFIYLFEFLLNHVRACATAERVGGQECRVRGDAP